MESFQEYQSRNIPPAKRNKYGNVPTDGYHSKREAARAAELKLLLKAGKIKDLKEQVKHELIPAQYDENGRCVERSVSYISDFEYLDDKGVKHWEDVKGFKESKTWILKRKLMLWIHGIRVKEV